MRFFRLAFLLVLFAFISAPVFAQNDRDRDPEIFARSGRLVEYVNRLVEQSERLADSAYRDYSNKNNNNRNDAEAMILAQQFDASSAAFRRMVQDRRRRQELRDGAQILSELVRQSDRYGMQRSEWNTVRRTVNDILTELNATGSGGGNNGGTNTGRIRWRGTVDDRVQLVIQGSYLEVKPIGGTPYGDGTTNFNGILPDRQVNVRVNKIDGRGDVRIIQQPSRFNNFTAIVEISDPKGGARDYEVEIYW